MAAATEVKCLVDHDWGCKKFCVNGQLSINDPIPGAALLLGSALIGMVGVWKKFMA